VMTRSTDSKAHGSCTFDMDRNVRHLPWPQTKVMRYMIGISQNGIRYDSYPHHFPPPLVRECLHTYSCNCKMKTTCKLSSNTSDKLPIVTKTTMHLYKMNIEAIVP
jgi:hypothetical protein